MRQKVTFGLFVFALLLLGPILRNEPYWLGIIIECIYCSILAISWLLILRIGHLSLAHAAFMGIGGISSALLVMEAGLSFWLALPLAGLISAIVALVVGLPILRVRGIYFLIITFAFNELVILMIKNWKLLGGEAGISDIPRPNSIGAIDFLSRVHYYYLLLFLAAVTVIVFYRIYRSRLGRVFSSIGEDEDLAQSVGINVLKYKLLAFAIGCFFAGLIGSFVVHYMNFSHWQMYITWKSLNIQIYAIVGGMGYGVGGPITGAFFLILFHWLVLVDVVQTPEAQPLVYAGILILVIFFLRRGLMSLPHEVSTAMMKLPRLKTRGTNHGTA